MLKKFRKLFVDVVGDDSSTPCEIKGKETKDKNFDTPPMDELLEENQTADEL